MKHALYILPVLAILASCRAGEAEKAAEAPADVNREFKHEVTDYWHLVSEGTSYTPDKLVQARMQLDSIDAFLAENGEYATLPDKFPINTQVLYDKIQEAAAVWNKSGASYLAAGDAEFAIGHYQFANLLMPDEENREALEHLSKTYPYAALIITSATREPGCLKINYRPAFEGSTDYLSVIAQVVDADNNVVAEAPLSFDLSREGSVSELDADIPQEAVLNLFYNNKPIYSQPI